MTLSVTCESTDLRLYPTLVTDIVAITSSKCIFCLRLVNLAEDHLLLFSFALQKK